MITIDKLKKFLKKDCRHLGICKYTVRDGNTLRKGCWELYFTYKYRKETWFQRQQIKSSTLFNLFIKFVLVILFPEYEKIRRYVK